MQKTKKKQKKSINGLISRTKGRIVILSSEDIVGINYEECG